MANNKPSQALDEDHNLTFEKAKEQLVEAGKKTGEIAFEEVAERLSGFEIESEQMDEFFEYLGEQGVEIIGETIDEHDTKEAAKGAANNTDLGDTLANKIRETNRMNVK